MVQSKLKKTVLIFCVFYTQTFFAAADENCWEKCLPSDLLEEIERGTRVTRGQQTPPVKDENPFYFFLKMPLKNKQNAPFHQNSLSNRAMVTYTNQVAISATCQNCKDHRILGFADGSVTLCNQKNGLVRVSPYRHEMVKCLLFDAYKNNLGIIYQSGITIIASIKHIFHKKNRVKKILATFKLPRPVSSIKTSDTELLVTYCGNEKITERLQLRSLPEKINQEEFSFLNTCFHQLQCQKKAIFLPQQQESLFNKIKGALTPREEKRFFFI